MKNEEETTEVCPIEKASRLVGDFWSLLIIRELLKGSTRFNELHENIHGITNSTLSERLKRLVTEDIVKRKQYQCIPPKVEYSLTKKGEYLKPVIDELSKLGEKLIG